MTTVTVNKDSLIELIDYILYSERTHFQEHVGELFDLDDDNQFEMALQDDSVNHIYKTAMLLLGEVYH